MKITVEPGSLQCTEKCNFSRTCANHVTAGDFRSESGFSPELSLGDNGIDYEVDCKTKEQPISLVSGHQTLPANIDELTEGMLYLEGREIKRYDMYPDEEE